MPNDIEQLIEAVQELSAPEEVKQGLIAKLQAGGVTAEVLEEMRPWIEQEIQKAEAEDPEIQTIVDEGVAQLDQAGQEFEQEIAKIEADADAIYQKASAQIDELELQQAQQTVSNA